MLNLYFPDIPGTKATDTRQLKSFVILTGVMYMLRVVSDDNSSSKFARFQKGPIDMCLFPVTNPQEHISILRLSHGMESVT
uniref:AlNc14C213G8952 protein n=1 Tax=Albugo laibachii Nc14 TaxID=890382 RepID=F0WRE8_9STRA|nr:AlNc14C213G8952 [Albugo laibachii Nc14]|eukprot:CCA23911.1 AlNc14C213G8952 [Albugo laibachii Nc14]